MGHPHPTSWVIRRRATGEVLFETFSPAVAAAVNRAAYDTIPILDYLVGVTDHQGNPRKDTQ